MQSIEDFDLALLRFNDEVIEAGSFKLGFKQDIEVINTTTSYEGVGYRKKNRTYEFEASDIPPSFLSKIKKFWLNSVKGSVQTFNITEAGEYVPSMVLVDAIITEFDIDQNDGQKINFKGQALRMIQ